MEFNTSTQYFCNFCILFKIRIQKVCPEFIFLNKLLYKLTNYVDQFQLSINTSDNVALIILICNFIIMVMEQGLKLFLCIYKGIYIVFNYCFSFFFILVRVEQKCCVFFFSFSFRI